MNISQLSDILFLTLPQSKALTTDNALFLFLYVHLNLQFLKNIYIFQG